MYGIVFDKAIRVEGRYGARWLQSATPDDFTQMKCSSVLLWSINPSYRVNNLGWSFEDSKLLSKLRFAVEIRGEWQGRTHVYGVEEASSASHPRGRKARLASGRNAN